MDLSLEIVTMPAADRAVKSLVIGQTHRDASSPEACDCPPKGRLVT
jgi:hypothetical protein